MMVASNMDMDSPETSQEGEWSVWQYFQQAKDAAVAYLYDAAHSEAEVRRYLQKKKQFPEPVVEKALSWLHEMHWLDDQDIAQRMVQKAQQRSQPESRQALKQRLLRRGLKTDTVASALAEIPYDEYQGALHAGRKKLSAVDRRLASEGVTGYLLQSRRQALVAGYLIRRGYSSRTVKDVLKELLGD